MKYGTIWATRRIERSAPDAPGPGEERVQARRVAPREAQRGEGGDERQHPEGQHVLEEARQADTREVDGAMIAVSASPAASLGAVIARPATL
jgi:hypothetical protein